MTFFRCERCDSTRFHVLPGTHSHEIHLVCAYLVCENCHVEYELLSNNQMELARNPGEEWWSANFAPAARKPA